MLKSYCINSNDVSDLFVGLRFKEGIPQIVFPHGYSISSDDKECRKDIFLLLSVLEKFSKHREGEMLNKKNKLLISFPFTSYHYVIIDYFQNGYYVENEVRYKEASRGKINWKRTIQKENPQIDNDNVIYLNFQVKTNQINENNLLTQIHRYCVYKSFFYFGWLFFSINCLPEKPEIPFNEKLFLSTLYDAMANTFDDKKRMLFQSMINIIKFEGQENDNINISCGVNRFDPVWEKLIDFVFGENDKDKYFPHATWHIIRNNKFEKSSALEPDTIMKYNNKIFVLDAKYYKFGITGYSSDLPATASIQKQITYGKHIAEKMLESATTDVYNAFIMPFESTDIEKLKFVSIATADWEIYNKNTKNYAYVVGILLDTKYLLHQFRKHNESEIEIMAMKIEDSLSTYRRG